ncbi:Trypsin-1-like 3 [Homarus americanus]|uniref:Trypsin-1-like 3 n=1 Tax=Homarus americanus TaxID=6706 RepID=A0A8J5N6X2_HOMAM|nr:Trypsin-1-like 3 [Homarus americanus]
MGFPHALLLQQHFMNYQLLYNQYLIPSLLLSLNFPGSPDKSPGRPLGEEIVQQFFRDKNSTQGWPTMEKKYKYFLQATQKFSKKEDLRISVMANQLALAHLSQFPWLVSIRVSNSEMTKHLCGGTLISPNWVVTAAHCLNSEKTPSLEVVAGELDINHEEGTEQRFNVTKFIQHPQHIYTQGPYNDDIALLHLAQPAVFNQYVQALPLPSQPMPALTKGVCQEAGWGATGDSASSSNVLMYADVPLLPRDQCQAIYSFVNENEFCAGAEGFGFCAGDNGGSLVCKTVDKGILSGVMSWREGCAQTDKPGVYMDIGRYLPWIHNTTGL